MKKILAIMTLGFSAFTMSASELPPPDLTPLIEKILSLSGIAPPYTNLASNVEELTLAHEIPRERMTKVLESIIREGLADLEKMDDPRSHHHDYEGAFVYVISPMQMLQGLNETNSFIALLRECVLSRNGSVFVFATSTYVTIVGTDAIPLLREAIETRLSKCKPYETARLSLYNFFGGGTNASVYAGFIREFKEKHPSSEADKFYAFMIDMAQTENNPFSIVAIDEALCHALSDYKHSVQRERISERGATIASNLNSFAVHEAFRKMRSKVEEVPSDKRTDLSKRLKLAEPPKEEGGN